MERIKSTKSLEELLASTRAAISSGKLSEAEKSKLEEYCKQFEQMPGEERESIDYFYRHMPGAESDVTLIVLKGHLLIEQKIREFVSERMLSPAALDDARLTSHQVICLAEALTLPNDEPRLLWSILRKLNTLRNQLAHNLIPKGIEQRVQEILTDYSKMWQVQAGFIGVLAHAYGQVSELCRLARNPSFQIRGR